MQRNDQRAWASARQVEVDGVVEVRTDALDVAVQGDRVFVSRHLAVAAAPAAGQLVVTHRKRRGVECHVEEQGQAGVEASPDHALEQTPGISADPAGGARALERPHVQQHGRATRARPR